MLFYKYRELWCFKYRELLCFKYREHKLYTQTLQLFYVCWVIVLVKISNNLSNIRSTCTDPDIVTSLYSTDIVTPLYNTDKVTSLYSTDSNFPIQHWHSYFPLTAFQTTNDLVDWSLILYGTEENPVNLVSPTHSSPQTKTPSATGVSTLRQYSRSCVSFVSQIWPCVHTFFIDEDQSLVCFQLPLEVL